MKKILFMCMAACVFNTGFTQDEKKEENQKSDTIRIGGMIIIKKAGSKDNTEKNENTDVKITRRKYKSENVKTNWWIVDIGFSNYKDETNYTQAQSSGFVGAGIGKDQLELRSGKSKNVNIWFFMQQLNMIKHVVNLKYGIGLELNNYHFDDETIRLQKNPTKIVLDNTLKDAKKNKLAADYLTVPMMLNFNFTPDRRNGFGFSGGFSAGYLYSARQKTKLNDNVDKLHNDFDLKRWKLAYIGELNLGPVKLYGSYAVNNMWDKGLNQTPYTVGFRFGNL
jgi:hypothetical protein